MLRNEAAFIGSPELRASYELCAAETRQFLAPMWTATEMLPAAIRPHFQAVHGFTVRTDRIADEERRPTARSGSPDGAATPWRSSAPGAASTRCGGRSWTRCGGGIWTVR